jgi:hypothetical protein
MSVAPDDPERSSPPTGPLDTLSPGPLFSRMPARFVVLLNPAAGRVRRRPDAVRALARSIGGDDYVEATDPRGMAEAIARLDPREDDVLCVVAGDGTLHGVLTALERWCPTGPWPVVAAAPGGTTNMTARDLGPAGRLVPWLEALRTWKERAASYDDVRTRLVQRPVLRISPGRAEPLSGTILGAGLVSDGVDFAARRLKPVGIPERLASPIALVRMLAAIAFGGSALDRMALPMRIRVDGELELRAPGVGLAVSTLDRLVIGARPFWGASGGPIHMTFVERTADAILRSVPRAILGRPGRRMTAERGWHSHHAARIELAFDGPYVVDGELYHARLAEGPLEITAPRVVRWWVP